MALSLGYKNYLKILCFSLLILFSLKYEVYGEEVVEVPSEKKELDLLDLNLEEVQILLKLNERRAALEKREAQLHEKEKIATFLEKKVNEKLAEMKSVQKALEEKVKNQEEGTQEQVKHLVKVYENMKPDKAAAIFSKFRLELLLDILEKMRDSKMAAILAFIDPRLAQKITFELAQRKKIIYQRETT